MHLFMQLYMDTHMYAACILIDIQQEALLTQLDP